MKKFRRKTITMNGYILVTLSDSRAHGSRDTYLRFMIPVDISRSLGFKAGELVDATVVGDEMHIKRVSLSVNQA